MPGVARAAHAGCPAQCVIEIVETHAESDCCWFLPPYVPRSDLDDRSGAAPGNLCTPVELAIVDTLHKASDSSVL